MRRLLLAAVVVAGCVVLALNWGPVAAWCQGFFGFRSGDGNGSHYLFWSGSGSDLAYLSVIGGAVVLYRANNCKRRWCPFVGTYEFTDPADHVTRKLCWLHHPDVMHKTLTGAHIRGIQERRHLYFGDRPGKG
jgi:hypothetical protein